MTKSKWVNLDKFQGFAEQKSEEKEDQDNRVGGGLFLKWKTPEKGTQEKEKTYKVRLLPDKNGGFYKKYFYHFFYSGDKKANYVFCPKTHDLNAFCPWCYASSILYQGNATDKRKAYSYSKKERYVSNVYVVHDPRDSDVEDEKYKVTNKVRLYEFPPTLEKLIKKEITNSEEGYGHAIFDPENGYDFIIKVASKKPDKDNKIWPDYSLTAFSRKRTSIAETDERSVDEIMKEVYDLDEYFENMEVSMDFHKKLLKSEELWEDVEDKFNTVYNLVSSVKKDNKPEEKESPIIDGREDKIEDDVPFSKEESLDNSDDSSDEVDEKELLEQLKALGS